MKTKKKFIIKILSLLFSIVIIHLFFFYSVHSYRCSIEGGKEKWIDGLDITVCIIKTNDHGKYCIDDFDCEDYCVVENENALEKKWIELFGNNFAEVDVKEFEEKSRMKIGGYCSKFKPSQYCGNTEAFHIRNGMIRYNSIRWKLPTLNCDDYFKD